MGDGAEDSTAAARAAAGLAAGEPAGADLEDTGFGGVLTCAELFCAELFCAELFCCELFGTELFCGDAVVAAPLEEASGEAAEAACAPGS